MKYAQSTGVALTALLASCATPPSWKTDFLATTQRYEQPNILIGYDRSNTVPFNPTNQGPAPSLAVLQNELATATDPRRRLSIQSAMTLATACESTNTPYTLAGLVREREGYEGMFQRDSFPTHLVYCLGEVDASQAREVQEGHKYAWFDQRETRMDVQSYQFTDLNFTHLEKGGK